MRNEINADVLQNLCANLTLQAWSQHDLFLPQALMLSLAAECQTLHQDHLLKWAQVGRAQEQSQHTHIRSDQIAWIEREQSPACASYLDLMEQLRMHLNQGLYLGLEEYETHFAFYSPGAAYSKHKDRFHNNDARTISIVIYLNEDWLLEQGGALRLHPHELPIHDITPIACRMVVFLSAELLHEVLPATRDRMSLTGWFRRRV
jgi:SM-20-related protein